MRGVFIIYTEPFGTKLMAEVLMIEGLVEVCPGWGSNPHDPAYAKASDGQACDHRILPAP
jgi:hypothetical protein